MTVTSGQAIGLTANTQLDFTSPGAHNPLVGLASISGGIRGVPYTDFAPNGTRPAVVVAPNGKKMLRFTSDENTIGECYEQFKFQHPLAVDEVVFEMEMAFMADADATNNRVDTFRILDDDNNACYLRFQPANRGTTSKGWQIAHEEAAGFEYTAFSAAGPVDTTAEVMSFRFAFTPSSDPGVADDGTLVIYAGVGGQSILDKDHRGTTFTSWTQVASVTHTLGYMSKFRGGWQNNHASSRGDEDNAGFYIRYIAFYSTEDPPCAIDSTDCSWFTLPALSVEMVRHKWNATHSKYDIRMSVRYNHDLFGANDAADRIGIKGRAWSDYDTFISERATGSAGDASGGFVYVAGDEDSDGYYRAIIEWTDANGWEADTTYWYDTHVHYDLDGETDSFFNSSKTDGDVHGKLTLPGARGVRGSCRMRFGSSSCINTQKIGESLYSHAGRTTSIHDSTPPEYRKELFHGDYGYPDEIPWTKGGVEREGAETVAQYKMCYFITMHSFEYLSYARNHFWSYVSDDHEFTNDGSYLDCFAWGDSVAGGPTEWDHDSVAQNHGTLGFPYCVKDGAGTNYRIRPAELARISLTARQEVFGIMYDTGDPDRFDASSEDLYGVNQGARTDKFLATDSLTRIEHFDLFSQLTLDTRLLMDRSNVNDSKFLGDTQLAWVEAKIAAVTVPNLIIQIPGYIQGAGPAFSLKINDFPGGSWPGRSDFTRELYAVFKTSLDANPLIKNVYVMCGDHHFLTTDTTISHLLSQKIRVQMGTGGAYAIRQDPEDLDDTDYDYIGDAGAGSGGVVRTKSDLVVTNPNTGAATVYNYRVTIPWDSDDDEGLDSLGTVNIPNVGLHGARTFNMRDFAIR